ncbi:hypothetical protein [Nonomuraea sp. NPDC048916]|uniref:hypothetical protein n=1 Tax=Nonomuraea sp. NPDC048916 TaxID=3154232 RepID=UPI0033F507AF
MRVIYRGCAVVAAVAVAAVGLVFVLPSRPDEVAAGQVAAPSAVPASSVPAPMPTPSPSPTTSLAAATPRPTPTPGTSLTPGYTAMEALYADIRVPRLPAKVKRLALRSPGKHAIKDTRSGLAVPRLGGQWKRHGAAPFTTKQVLPIKRGSTRRGTFVTCPLPIEEQAEPRDTALLAARWTLNHHPKGATITWIASQPVKDGWMLVYQVKYGKSSSRAAVAVVDGGMAKPGLAFVSVPDTQRDRWPDVTRAASWVRVPK